MELHEWLLSHGHESWVFVSKGERTQELCQKRRIPDLAYIGLRNGNKVHALEARLTGLQAHGSRFATILLTKRLAQISPDVVILRNIHANYINISILLKWLARNKVPTVLFLDDCWYFTGKCSHYTSAGCTRWKSGCGDCPRLKADIPSWFFDRTAQMFREKQNLYRRLTNLGVIGVSDWVLGESQNGMLGCASSVKRIYNWIDLDTFKPCSRSMKGELGIKGSMILCVSSGWNQGSKRLENLRSIAKEINQEETLVVVGDAQKGLLPENCMHVPLVSDAAKLAALYSTADVCLHLGEEDTFGKVIAESLACGTPVVAFDSTVYPELITEGCGTTVPVGDINQLRRALNSVLYEKGADPLACREKAISEFDKAKLIAELIAYLRGVTEC